MYWSKKAREILHLQYFQNTFITNHGCSIVISYNLKPLLILLFFWVWFGVLRLLPPNLACLM